MTSIKQLPFLAFGIIVGLAPLTQSIAAIVSFRQGLQSYTGTEDTYMSPSNPNSQFGASPDILVTREGSSEGLLEFTGLFGTGTHQIPFGATINSATLTLVRAGGDANGASIGAFRMLIPWSEDSTWNSLSSGVQRNDIEASSMPDATSVIQNSSSATWDVTSSVAAWATGGPNYGWLLAQSDNTQFSASGIWSSEDVSGRTPILTVAYEVPEPSSAVLLVFGALAASRRSFTRTRRGS